MKKHDEIITRLGLMNQRLINIERLASDKAVKLEQALRLAENQKEALLNLVESGQKEMEKLITKHEELRTENEKLKTENEELKTEAARLERKLHLLQEGDALMAPNNQIISFPEGESIKITHPAGGYYLITRDGLDCVSANGKVLKVR